MTTNVFCAPEDYKDRKLQTEVQEQWSHLQVETEPSFPSKRSYQLACFLEPWEMNSRC